jgi:hypothetical protein
MKTRALSWPPRARRPAMLLEASELQYVHEPGYAAIIFRKSFSDLAQPGAIMDRAKEWHAVWRTQMGLRGVRWNEHDKVMTFPSGARIVFAHLGYENEKYRYQGAEYQAHGRGHAPISPSGEVSLAEQTPTLSRAGGSMSEGC